MMSAPAKSTGRLVLLIEPSPPPPRSPPAPRRIALELLAGRSQHWVTEVGMTEKLASYEAFWPFYVSQHLDLTNRRLHFAGTTLALAAIAASILYSPAWLLATPFAGYGLAWIGHFFFEKNKPATFSHPLWSLRGDFRMFRLMWLGRMGPEIARAHDLFPARA
jgi:hypothetical protein